MSSRRIAPGSIALLLAGSLLAPPACAQGIATGTLAAGGATTNSAPAFFQRSDIAFALVTTAAVAVAGHNDPWLRSRALTANSRFDRDLANVARPLGDPALVLPVLLAGYGLTRALHAPVAAGFTEIGLSIVAAGAGALVVKEVVGRRRPDQLPVDSHSFHAFSGDAAFPSGHSTVAFALAESVNRTSGRAWVPFVSYPAATLVAWSRVRDDRHWTSDVLAGAALGIWTARKVHREWPAERRLLSRLGFTVCAPAGAPGLAITFE